MPKPKPISPDSPRLTRDLLLGGRVILVQPARGNRAAIDPVFLAAAVPAQAGEHVLELGCGTGAAALCLAARIAECRVTGIDIQSDLIALADESARASGLADRARFVAADLVSLPHELGAQRFDHVMANPPYRRADAGRASPDRARTLATVEGAAALGAWVACAVAQAKQGGSVTFVHTAERAGEVAGLFVAHGADAIIYQLWPKQVGSGAKRALIQGRRGGDGGIRSAAGLVLHNADGSYTAEADAILRHARAIAISAV